MKSSASSDTRGSAIDAIGTSVSTISPTLTDKWGAGDKDINTMTLERQENVHSNKKKYLVGKIRTLRSNLTVIGTPLHSSGPASSVQHHSETESAVPALHLNRTRVAPMAPPEDTISLRSISTVSSYSSGPTCRICYGDDRDAPHYSPCSCRGTLAFIHEDCLNLWMSKTGWTECELCQSEFKVERQLIKPFYKWKFCRRSYVAAQGGLEESLRMMICLDAFILLLITIHAILKDYRDTTERVELMPDSVKYSLYTAVLLLCSSIICCEFKRSMLPALKRFLVVNSTVRVKSSCRVKRSSSKPKKSELKLDINAVSRGVILTLSVTPGGGDAVAESVV